MKKVRVLLGCIMMYLALCISVNATESEKTGTIRPGAWMYSESISTANETEVVCDGDMIAEINLGTTVKSGKVWCCFVIYDADNRMIDAAAASVFAPCGENIILTIEDFEAESNEVYKAKVFLWTDTFTPICEAINLTDKKTAADYVDFVVKVPENRDMVVLQLTDTQIEDSTQVREGSSFNSMQDAYWKPEYMDERCFDICRQTVEKTKPDLILVTGDLVYGKYDDKGTSFTALVEFFESLDIPWAPVFGNHDNESYKGADWQCEQLENAENCLFKQRTLTGNGNYSVGIMQGGKLKRVFFMLDSNGCASMSSETFSNGHSRKDVGFGQDQIDWYTDVAENISEKQSGMKYTFAFHIQPVIFKEAYKKYGFTNSGTQSNPINIDIHPNKAESDFGYIGRDLKSAWDNDYSLYNGMKTIGTDSILVGHEHCNSASVVYDGIRFQYGQKSSAYDRINFKKADGTIEGAGAYYTRLGEQILGGTVMTLSEADGKIDDAYIYYYKNQESEEPELEVNGLKISTGELIPADSMSVETVEKDGFNAYKLTPQARCKLYVSSGLIANKSGFKFSVYIPEETTNMGILNGAGEFAIRVKPNEIEPEIDGVTNGYIVYSSKSENESVKLVHGEWKTYIVDISTFGENCTEFAFDVPQGNVIYLKDIIIS